MATGRYGLGIESDCTAGMPSFTPQNQNFTPKVENPFFI
jgi:hypothetical protein